MDQNDNIKELIINEIMYAKYIPGAPPSAQNILWIKVLKNIVPGNTNQSETELVNIISLIENKKFTGVAYLNVK